MDAVHTSVGRGGNLLERDSYVKILTEKGTYCTVWLQLFGKLKLADFLTFFAYALEAYLFVLLRLLIQCLMNYVSKATRKQTRHSL